MYGVGVLHAVLGGFALCIGFGNLPGVVSEMAVCYIMLCDIGRIYLGGSHGREYEVPREASGGLRLCVQGCYGAAVTE